MNKIRFFLLSINLLLPLTILSQEFTFKDWKQNIGENFSIKCDSGNCKDGIGQTLVTPKGKNKSDGNYIIYKGLFKNKVFVEGEYFEYEFKKLIHYFKGSMNVYNNKLFFEQGVFYNYNKYGAFSFEITKNSNFMFRNNNKDKNSDSIFIKSPEGHSYRGFLNYNPGINTYPYINFITFSENGIVYNSYIKANCQFKNDPPWNTQNTLGIINFDNGDRFEGTIFYDIKDYFFFAPKSGTMYFKNGDKFEGSFSYNYIKNKIKNGLDILYESNGKYFFKNGNILVLGDNCFGFSGPAILITPERATNVWVNNLEIIAEGSSPLYKKLYDELMEKKERKKEFWDNMTAKVNKQLGIKDKTQNTEQENKTLQYCVVYSLEKTDLSFGSASIRFSMVFVQIDDYSNVATIDQVKALAEETFLKNITLNKYKITNIQVVKGNCYECKKEIINKGVKLDDFRILGAEIPK